MMSMGYESVMGLRVKNSLVVRSECDGFSGYLQVNGSEYAMHIIANLATRHTRKRLTFWSNIGQLDSSRRNKLQRLVHILGHLHFDARGFIVTTKRRIS